MFKRKSGPLFFTPKRLSRGLPYEVIACSTLVPLVGKPVDEEDAHRRAVVLIKHWRMRVAALEQHGWELTGPHVDRDGREAKSRKWRM